MAFNYSKSGLPANEKWELAAQICNQWLNENMSMFGPERIESFMMHQPVAAAKLILENCDDWSEESITLVLLGPAKGILLTPGADEIEAHIRAQVEQMPPEARAQVEPQLDAVIAQNVDAIKAQDAEIRAVFGDRTVELMKYFADFSAVDFDSQMPADKTRIFLVEGLSTMNDQLIGRAKIDAHHERRWMILDSLSADFGDVKGQNPGLDKIFEEALQKSLDSLNALGRRPPKFMGGPFKPGSPKKPPGL